MFGEVVKHGGEFVHLKKLFLRTQGEDLGRKGVTEGWSD